MKKIIGLFLIALPFAVFGQDDETLVSQFKPAAGEKTLELQFAPFGDNPISLNGIRARWFLSEQSAFRLNAFLSFNSDSDIIQQEDDDLNREELKNKNVSFTINLRPGLEKHLKGTEKLSPYFGGELDLAYRGTSFKTEVQVSNEVKYNKQINANGFFRAGVNAIAGLDFYISKKLYLGTEFGFGVSLSKPLSVKVKSDRTGFEEPEPEKRGSSVDLGPNVNAQIRLGYAF